MSDELSEFFVVSLPGLEDIVEAEIKEWFPTFTTKTEHGGVSVHAELGQGLAMNLVLKTATRILIRIKTVRVRDFPKLYQTLLALPWSDWVDPACELNVHVATRLSRLKIKSRIEETCQDAWMDYRAKLGTRAERGRKLDLFVRFVNDECTLSLDTSGERLHKRGARTHVGEAPLRETIAAALLRLVAASDPEAKTIEVLDPMVGSGTFLLEALERDTVVDRREFAFKNFRVDEVARPPVPQRSTRVVRLVGLEKEAKTLTAARTNLKRVSANEAKVELMAGDVFVVEPLEATEERRWLLSNPPYGERLKVDQPLLAYYEQLFAASERWAKPARACFLLPAKVVKGKFRLPAGWRVVEKRPFVNGGIPVIAFVFARS